MIVVSPSSAVIPTEFTEEDGETLVSRWRTVALLHMVQFSDLDAHISGKNRKRRR
jgi:hypothetical protein